MKELLLWKVKKDREQSLLSAFLLTVLISGKNKLDDEVILPVQKLVAYEEEMDEKQSDEILVTAEKANSILVIEDNEELLHLMTKLLRHEYNVFTAENGKEGLQCWRMKTLI